MKEKYRILFIGNSYTYFNDMPSLFVQISEKAGYTVEVDSVVRGGWTLEKHALLTSETGAEVEARLCGEPYDYVILQEQSVRPAVDPELFYCAVRKLVGRVRQTGAVPVLYSTWGRKVGSVKLNELGLTHESMTYALARAYRDIASELGVAVSYVGLAFLDVGEAVELYDPDKSHPSLEGSYLAALTLFFTVFGDTDAVYSCGLDKQTVSRLVSGARRAVYHTPNF